MLRLTSVGFASVLVVVVHQLSAEGGDASPSGRPKILCLHGGGQTVTSFEATTMRLRDAVSSRFEFVFAAAAEAHNVWTLDPPGGKNAHTTDPNWASASVNYLNNLVQTQGPFYGILGYSQGAEMSITYLSQAPPGTFQVALLFCGYLPLNHHGLLQNIDAQSPFGGIRALLFMGQRDFTIPNSMTLEAATKFSSPLVLTSSTAGHDLPSTTDPTFNEVVSFLVANDTNSTDDPGDDMISGSVSMSQYSLAVVCAIGVFVSLLH